MAVVGAVVTIAVAAFVFAIDQLTASSAPAITSGSGHTNTTQAQGLGAALLSWAPGLDGYTVVLANEPTDAGAVAEGDGLLATGIKDVGVLATAQHPGLKPAHSWDVFVGRYPSHAAAAEAASALQGRGQTGATVVDVQSPGAP
jgi:hypothetical protein